MTFYERSELFRKYPKTPVFDHSNYRLFERIHAVPGSSNNRGLTVSGLLIFICNNSRNAIFHDTATIKLQVYNIGLESFTDG